MSTDHQYIECKETDIPRNVRFDTAERDQGQMVEVAYGTFGHGEAGPGDPYKRIVDRSVAGAFATVGHGVTFYKKVAQ